jgi:5-methylcytosine-specific restriction endonuclease McrBC regulatory subunit McrC
MSAKDYPVHPEKLKHCTEWTAVDLEKKESKNCINLSDYSDNLHSSDCLGLHRNTKGEISASHFTGAMWLDAEKKLELLVKPKLPQLALVSMLLKISSDPEFTAYNETSFFRFYSEQPSITVSRSDDLSIFQIAVFLQSLQTLCRRHLRSRFFRESENLTGKIKGRLLISRHFDLNISQGRLDRAFCSYENISINCLENQILKSALQVCAKFLNQNFPNFKDHTLWSWIKFCESSLAAVENRVILDTDFKAIKFSGVFSFYKDSINLARMILKRFSTDPGSTLIESGKTVPYWIDMNKLFEFYVRATVKNSLPKTFWSMRKYRSRKNIFSSTPDLKITKFFEPDIWLDKKGDVSKCMILDAKYKPWLTIDQRSDIHQILAYGKVFNAEGLGIVFPKYKDFPDKIPPLSVSGEKKPFFLIPIDLSFEAGEETFEDLRTSLI